MTATSTVDNADFRRVLGHFPTGVVVVTAMDDGEPVGMTVGSFTSVSLDPPLVGFLPGKTSTSWPGIKRAGAFCANVLAADQERESRAFSGQDDDKFRGLAWTRGPSGAPLLNGVLAWIDCRIEGIVDAGDHWFVLGGVNHLAVEREHLPLVFFRGGYGSFTV